MGEHKTATASRHHKEAEMSLKAALAPLLVCLVSGAPYNEAQTAPQTKSVSCRTEYSVVWDTQYQEKEQTECVTNYEKVCRTVTERLCKATTRQECQTIYEKSCNTVYKSVCVDQYKTEYEPYTETECTTEYKEDCEFQWEGYGNNKVWAKIPGTCKQNPYDNCQDVTRPRRSRLPTQCATMFPNRSVSTFLGSNAVRSLTRFVTTSPCNSARMCPASSAPPSTRKFQSELAKISPRKSVTLDTLSNQ